MAPKTKSAGLQDVGFWTRFWSRVTGRAMLDQGQTARPFDAYSTDSGSVVTPQSALKLSAAWACVTLRAASISSLPLVVRDAGKVALTDDPLYRMLHDEPNADMCTSEWLECQIAALDLWGNAYSRIEREGGRVVALTPLFPDIMSVRRRSDGRLAYDYRRQSNTETLDEDDVLHLRGFTLDGCVGLSPVQYAAQAMGAQMDANTAASREFKNGLKVGGFLKTGAGTLSPDQRKMLRESLEKFGLPQNAGKWMVLEAGMEPASSQGIRMNPVDAQLLESRYFGIEEICRAYRTPPVLVGHGDKASSWASSLENTNLGYLTYTLRPTLVRIEQTMRRKLLTPAQRAAGVQIKFSVGAFLRTDSAARTALYASGLQNGWIDRNEVRELEDLPPRAGGDQLTVQTNLTTLEKLGAVPAAGDAAKAAVRAWLNDSPPET